MDKDFKIKTVKVGFGRRSAFDRRRSPFGIRLIDRRSGVDRRSGMDRRSFKTIKDRFHVGMKKESG